MRGITISDQTVVAVDPKPTSFVLKVGDGSVSVCLKTGKVTFENCTPDEAAKSFWDAVERMFNLTQR